MVIIWIRKIALAAIIIGFFLPFINTCTRKDRQDRKAKVETDGKASFTKPDGKNYSGIGYIISDFTFDHLPIWLLIISLLAAFSLLTIQIINFKVSKVVNFIAAVVGVAGLLFLLYLEEIENLKYGFWTSLAGYTVFLSSFLVHLNTKLKSRLMLQS
ncbi:MAG: hypothetical protein ACKVOU_11495 [Cytophagales bacterium]